MSLPDWRTRTCKECGARYEVHQESVPFRDKDSLDCECGHELVRWNGGVVFTIVRRLDEGKATPD